MRKPEVVVHDNRFRQEAHPHVEVFYSEAIDQQGQYMMSLCERFGMIVAMDGGEDSSGRSKLKLMPANEVVARAAAIAELTFLRLRETGHISALPTVSEMKEILDNQPEKV